MRFTIEFTFYILDEQQGALEIEYLTKNLTKNEKLSIIIDNEERCKESSVILFIDFIKQSTLGDKESLIKFYLEPKVHKVEIVFESNGGNDNSLAQAIIKRVMVQGTDMGGAVECKACDPGSIANNRQYMCQKCGPGSQPNADCKRNLIIEFQNPNVSNVLPILSIHSTEVSARNVQTLLTNLKIELSNYSS